jgi:dTDP-4-amino-4,6-dideoxygalactose transaminase
VSRLAINGGAPVRRDPWPRWPQWGESERDQLQAVLDRGEWGGFDPIVGEFEIRFAERLQAKHCLTTANGTLSLVAALQVLGIGPGDEVIVPPYTFIATANAVQLVGATSVFVDIEPHTLNLDMSLLESAISARTKAVIPVHFAGLPVDLDRLSPLAQKHGLAVIEDAAHAHGSTWRGKPVGAQGDIGSFSFQASKNLTSGEGGALTTNHDDLKDKLWSYINQGRTPGGLWYEHENLGSNLRLTGWQAAILMAQLERFDDELARRMDNARRLHAILAEVDGLEPLHWDERAEFHAFHLFIMRFFPEGFQGVSRNRFVQALRAEGIPCSTGYSMPLYAQPPLQAPRSRILPCPTTEQACRESIWLTQNLLLAEPAAMDQIAEAIFKIRENIGELGDSDSGA